MDTATRPFVIEICWKFSSVKLNESALI